MEFYLVRHGEAVPERQNPARPLTPAGRAAVEHVGRAAAARHVQVAAILHSGILRARQTAEILEACLCPTEAGRAATGLLPEDDPLIAKAELESATQPILLVGHLPHLNRLAGLLISGSAQREPVPFAPAMMVCLSYEQSQWSIVWALAPEAG